MRNKLILPLTAVSLLSFILISTPAPAGQSQPTLPGTAVTLGSHLVGTADAIQGGPGAQTSGSTSGSNGGSTTGSTSGTTGGSTSGTTAGSTGGSTSGSTSGSTGGSTSGGTSGTTSGSTSGTTAGSTAGTTSGSTSGGTSGGPGTQQPTAPPQLPGTLPVNSTVLAVVNGFVSAASNTVPIVITTTAPHLLSDGQLVTISGVGGNSNANGTFFIKVTGFGASGFALFTNSALTTPVPGNGQYTFGGQFSLGNGQPGLQGSPAPEGVGFTPDINLQHFGDKFFEASRKIIDSLRGKLVQSGSVPDNGGPISLGNINASPPETYELGVGDKLTVRVWSPTTEVLETKLVIDSFGAIAVPVTGSKIVLRGKTVSQAEDLLQQEVGQYLKNGRATIQLSELRTFTVTLVGDSYAPGSYQVPATYSFFNAIMATGGPTQTGSLRRIVLKRNNSKLYEFDLYKFLVYGDASQDIPLEPGDVIFFSGSKSFVYVDGEVNRPGIYETKDGEVLSKILRFAGGVTASGVAQNVSIDSVVPGSIRRLIDANLQSQSNTPMHDGDKVHVFSIRSVLRNAVTIEGAVEQPRAYALPLNGRVRDLINLSLGFRHEADQTSGELRRLNPDGSQTMIRVDLSEAMKGNVNANLLLKPNDLLRIFDINDESWRGDRRVRLIGDVRNPGDFYRPDDMKVGDLIRQGHGLLADAYADEAHLQRYNADGTPGPLLKINLNKAALGDPVSDLTLKDRDVLQVYKITEWAVIPDPTVTVTGAVQRPADYTLADGMRVRDLLELAGQPSLDAYQDVGFLQRVNRDKTLGPLVLVNLKKALAGDPDNNVLLQSRDILSVYTVDEARFHVDRTVRIVGGVQRPGWYPRGDNMSLADLVALAGGTLPNSGPIAMIGSANLPEGSPVQKVALASASQFSMRDRDQVAIPVDASILSEPIQVIISGAVAHPGTYFFTTKNQKVTDLVKAAGGLRPEAWVKGAQVARKPAELRTDTQNLQEPRLAEVLQVIQADEYRRALAKAAIDRLTAVAKATKGGDTGSSTPLALPSLGNIGGSASGSTSGGGVSPLLIGPGLDGATQARPLKFQPIASSVALITDASNMNPIVIKTAAAHGLTDGQSVTVEGVGGNTNANGNFYAKVSGYTRTSFALYSNVGLTATVAGNAPYTVGGTVTSIPDSPNFELLGGNLNIQLDEALNHPNSSYNFTIKSGDIVTIPEQPTTVTVDGPGVAISQAFEFRPGKTLKYYIDASGDYTIDADPKNVIIIRPGGSLLRAKSSTKIEVGDVILVPTKVMTVQFGSKDDDFFKAISTISSAALLYGTFRYLVK